MNKRLMNKTGINCSTLGFGCMRMPTKKVDDKNVIDEEEAIKMIRYAIDNGVNYVDTAYPYHNGQSELLVAKALKDGYREKVVLATKLPLWKIEKPEDMEKTLDEQLEKLEVDYIDYYLLHALERNKWDKMKKFNFDKFFEDMKAKGKIKYAAFSFHDSYEIFEDIIDYYDWDMCQIQLNYMDTNWQAGLKGLKYAASKGIDVVVMEPLRGGDLVNNLPTQVSELFNDASISRKPVEWAFRWLYNFDEVKVILSGMSTMDQVKENIDIFKNAEPDSMNQQEKDIMEKAMEILNDKIKVRCTSCKYCMPCPQNVNIPMMFNNYNNYFMFDKDDKFQTRYSNWRGRDENKFTADLCVSCKKCEKMCPQNISISERLKEIDVELSG